MTDCTTDFHALFDRVIERRGTGAVKWDITAPDVIPLWVADMDFAAPAAVTDALARRVAHPIYGYPMVSDSYRHSFCEWQQRRNRLVIDPAWLLATPAVMPAVRAAIDAVSEPGDAVVVQTPVYFPFFHAIRSKGRHLVLNPLRETVGVYTMDLEHLEALFRDGARVLLLCSPHNPVARLWSRDELTALAELSRRWGVTVISDEIHSDIIFEPRPFVSMLEVLPELTVACFSVSKTFNLAGIGASQTVVPDPGLRSRVRRVCERDGLLSLQHVLSLTATEAAYRHGDAWLDALLDYLRGNHALLRTAVANRMSGVRAGVQEATYIAWLDLRHYCAERGLSESQLKRLLQHQARVKLSDGVQFGHGGLGFQRLNFATPRPILEEALGRIADALHRGYIPTV
ncbi:MAG: putative C-S lyase [Spirochaetaceae bacterium]|nr:MAG: putative C-S lyase [Spirochaetaceae bacterium]